MSTTQWSVVDRSGGPVSDAVALKLSTRIVYVRDVYRGTEYSVVAREESNGLEPPIEGQRITIDIVSSNR